MMMASLAVCAGRISRTLPTRPAAERATRRAAYRQANERLVVEADGQEPAQVPEGREGVVLGRGPPFSRTTRSARGFGHARSDAGLAVHGHEAVRSRP